MKLIVALVFGARWRCKLRLSEPSRIPSRVNVLNVNRHLCRVLRLETVSSIQSQPPSGSVAQFAIELVECWIVRRARAVVTGQLMTQRSLNG